MITRPLELLLEALLAPPAAGIVDADALEIAKAADLAGVAISVSLYLAATRHGCMTWRSLSMTTGLSRNVTGSLRRERA